MKTDKHSKRKFARTRFLAAVVMSSPAVAFVYSPLLAGMTVVGIVVPFAMGRFIDALVGGQPPVAPFAVLAALLAARAVLTPCRRPASSGSPSPAPGW